MSWPAIQRSIDDRPQVDDPPQQNNPEQGGQQELDDGQDPAALKQLSQSGDEKTAECGDDIGK